MHVLNLEISSMRKCVVLLLTLVYFNATATLRAGEAPLIKQPEYWFHVMSNTNNEEHMNKKVYPLMERAAKAGYTTISYHGRRFTMKDFQTPEYIERVKKFRARCTELNLKIAASTVGTADKEVARYFSTSRQ